LQDAAREISNDNKERRRKVPENSSGQHAFMHTFGRDRGLRWCLSGIATLVAHGVVMFALPDASPLHAAHQTHEESVWFALVETAEVGDNADERGGVAAAAKPRERVAKPTSARTSSQRRAAKTRLSEPDDAPLLSATAPGANALEGGEFAAHHAAAQEPAKELTERLASAAEGVATTGADAGNGRSAGTHGLATGGGVLGGHGPGLLAVPNACRGFFPAGAKVDHGEVRITVQVDAAGRPRASRLLTEMPLGQGFGRAAQACAAALRFTPAVDGQGSAIVADTKLELRFDRS
jgi:hypothetical protein